MSLNRHRVEQSKPDIKEYILGGFSCITYKSRVKHFMLLEVRIAAILRSQGCCDWKETGGALLGNVK